MKIAEIFYSIQGEGALVGAPAVFVRTSGCNLRCSWCDTPYTSWNPEGEDMTVEQIVGKVGEYRAPYVVLTGGEPMIAPAVGELTRLLRATGIHLTIETAGTVFQQVGCDLMSISPKLSNSTPDGLFRTQHERLRFQPEVLRKLMDKYEYQLKFVIAEPGDVEEVKRVAAAVRADPRRVILMAEGRDTATLHARGVWLAEICKAEGYRLSPRLHVDLWGDRRGV
jgi:7-carboxy-7-deazaguanine synthase